MFKNLTFFSAMSRLAMALALTTCLPFMAKSADDLGISFVTTQNGNQVVADVMVYNFDEILSMQFAVVWDPAVMQFESVGDFALPGVDDFANFGTTLTSNGMLAFSWLDPQALNGVSLPDCTAMFRIYFTSINGQVAPITASNSPIIIEIVNADIEFLNLVQGLGCTNFGTFSGIVFNDDNGNCIKDELESGLENCQVKLQQPGHTVYTSADSEGRFVYHGLPGDYAVSVIAPENVVWTPCQASNNIALAAGQNTFYDFGGAETANPSSASDLPIVGFSAKLVQNPVQVGSPINLAFNADQEHSLNVEILDIAGRRLLQTEQHIPSGSSVIQLSPETVAGVYWLKFTGSDGQFKTIRLVVQ